MQTHTLGKDDQALVTSHVDYVEPDPCKGSLIMVQTMQVGTVAPACVYVGVCVLCPYMRGLGSCVKAVLAARLVRE